MRATILILGTLILTGCAVVSQSEFDPAKQVVSRRIGDRASGFTFETIDSEMDVFEIEAKNGRIILRGNNPISQTSAFNWYLKHIANCQVSWNGDQLDLPAKLPAPAEKIRKESPYKWRHLYNYCTLSYTMAFKDWQDWEREIDIMAMRGINMALVLPGHEKIWQNVLRRIGYSDKDIAAFIPTSAHTSWWLMANLEGVSGTVPQYIIDGEARLGRKIVDRMRQLGIEPIVNSFFGMVPTTFKKYYPDADIIPQGNWGAGPRPAVISPLDPMFPKLAQIWYEELEKVYGRVNFFGGDLFHEGGKSGDLPLGDCAVSVQQEMLKHNPNAVWVMQSWQINPRQEMLDACDKEHFLVQQLAYSVGDWEKRGHWRNLRTFDGADWTLSFVLNFGGSEGFYGNLRALAKVPDFLKRRDDLKECVGYGLLCEGYRVNPISYDLLSDLTWTDSSPDVDNWLDGYVLRRYGKASDMATRAWRILEKTAYRVTRLQEGQTDSIICARPSKTVTKARLYSSGNLNYPVEEILKAAELLSACSSQLKSQDTYRYDLVDVTRQVLQDYARTLHPMMIDAYEAGDRKKFDSLSDRFLKLIDDMDRLLASDSNFLLGTWLTDARKKAATVEGKNLMERSGRFLITHWSDRSQPNLSDYSNRQWAGLTKDYYKPRWSFFIDTLKEAMDNPDQAVAIEKGYKDKLRKLERLWIDQTGTDYPTEVKGDSVKIASGILKEYAPVIRHANAEAAKKEQQDRKWQWDISTSGDKVQVLSWDVYSHIQNLGTGTYTAAFQWQGGKNALEIDYVELVQEDVVLARDEHLGHAGKQHKQNTYTLELEKMPATVAPYYIRASVRGKDGNNSKGRLDFKKIK